MSKLNIAEAVIFSNRADLRNAVRQELKNHEVKPDNIHNVQNAQQCLQKLQSSKAAFLVLDWEIGPDKVLEVLAANRGENRIESHPTFLIAARLDEHITSTATEYNVSQVHCGEISAELIKNFLREMVRDAANLSPIRQILINVENARSLGRLQEATEILEKVFEKSPKNSRIALELAESYMQIDLWDKAQAILEGFKDSDPPLARLRHLLARCYLKKGDHHRAIEALQGAQLVNPYNVERLLELGNLFLDIERPKDAKAAFDDILSFAPESKAGKLAKTTSMLAIGELNEALAILKGAANNREIAAVFNATAILSIRQGKHEAGLDLYRTAAAAIGNNPKILSRLMFNMGIGFVKWGKISDAMKCFEESIRLDPDFKDAAYNVMAMKKGKAKAPAAPAKMAVGQSMPLPNAKEKPVKLIEPDLSGLDEAIGGELDIEKGGGSLSFTTDFDDDLEI